MVELQQQITTQAGITCRHLATDLLGISFSISEGGNRYSPVGHWHNQTNHINACLIPLHSMLPV